MTRRWDASLAQSSCCWRSRPARSPILRDTAATTRASGRCAPALSSPTGSSSSATPSARRSRSPSTGARSTRRRSRCAQASRRGGTSVRRRLTRADAGSSSLLRIVVRAALPDAAVRARARHAALRVRPGARRVRQPPGRARCVAAGVAAPDRPLAVPARRPRERRTRGGSTTRTCPEPSYPRLAGTAARAPASPAAVLLLGAAGALAYFGWPRRQVEPEPEPEPEPELLLTPLERALELLEDAAGANGAADQRRSLELVAEVLGERGEEDGLAQTARELAWSPTAPPPDATRQLAARVRAALEEELRLLEEERLAGGGAPTRRRRRHMRWWSSRQPRSGRTTSRSFRAASRRDAGAARAASRGGAVLLLAAAVVERTQSRPARPRAAADRHDGRRRARPLALDPRRPVGHRAADAPDARRRGLRQSGSSSSRTSPTSCCRPGTPAKELRPIIRLLTPNAERQGRQPVVGRVPQPGRASRLRSSSRTTCSSATASRTARSCSSATSRPLPTTFRRRPRCCAAIQRSGTPVRLLALGPSSDARALFGGILGPGAFTPIVDGPVRAAEPPDAAPPAAAEDAAPARAALPRRARGARAVRRAAGAAGARERRAA